MRALNPLDERVLILAPVGRDGPVTTQLLRERGLVAEVCTDPSDASRQIAAGAGVLLLTQEALEQAGMSELLAQFHTQPPWSELPLIILTRGGESRLSRLLDLAAQAAGAVTLLERPLGTTTLLRTIEVALRSRRRQYQVRDLLEQQREQTAALNAARVAALNLVDDVERSAAALRESEDRLRHALEDSRLLSSIVESSDDAIISMSLKGIILTWNAAAERLHGYTAEEAIGQPITLVIPAERRSEENLILARIQAGEPVEHFDTVRMRKNGQTIPVSLTVSPVRDGQGRVVRASEIARNITERKRAEEQLREAARQKDEFLATLAHELRNPLAPIRNGLQLMKLAASDAKVVESARSMMERQVEQMTHLLNDLMDLSRISRGKIQLRTTKLKLADVVQNAIDTSRPLIGTQGHELVVDAPPEPIYVEGDLTRLSQVFANLLNNAAKYTEPGGRIRLAVERQGGDVLVSVEDNGVGIPANMLNKVFDIFAQVDRSLEKAQGGLGIGLNIVKRLVGMHGGTIAAQSGGPGRGSTFVVRLPVAPPATGDTPGNQCVCSENAKPVARRILVVDDNRDVAKSLAMVLRMMGNETALAHDGLEAIAAAEAFKPDVILMDIGMPRLNGYDACLRIREQPWGKNIVIVAQTGWGQEEDKRRAKEAKFDHHLTKPIDPAEIEELLSAPQSRSG